MSLDHSTTNCRKLSRSIPERLLATRSKHNLIHEQKFDPLSEKFYRKAETKKVLLIKLSAQKSIPKTPTLSLALPVPFQFFVVVLFVF